MISAGLKRTKV